MNEHRFAILTLFIAGLAACSSGGSGDGSADEAPPSHVANTPSALAFEALKSDAEEAERLDADRALARYATDFVPALSYDPSTSLGLDTIQGSALALSDGELAALGQNGFVISQRREFPTFLRGLAEIYTSHLPLYVTADALLDGTQLVR